MEGFCPRENDYFDMDDPRPALCRGRWRAVSGLCTHCREDRAIRLPFFVSDFAHLQRQKYNLTEIDILAVLLAADIMIEGEQGDLNFVAPRHGKNLRVTVAQGSNPPYILSIANR